MGHYCFEINLAIKGAREKFPVLRGVHGCLFKIVHGRFFFHALKLAKLFTPTITTGFFVAIVHVLIFASRLLFCDLFTGIKILLIEAPYFEAKTKL